MAGTAIAQKSADTLRVAITEPFPTLSPYFNPATEASFINQAVFQRLIGYDERNSKYVPVVAKSWKRVNDTTLEFDLFDDIKFHNGDALTADDVVYTFRYVADPKVNFRNKQYYLWVKNVEKLGPYKIRVTAKEFNALDLFHFAFRGQVEDAKVHEKLDDRAEYGRKTPVGSGPYKVTKFDRNSGVSLTRSTTFKSGPYERAPIKNLEALFITDPQTQIAQLLTDNVDLVFNVAPDNAKALDANPNIDVTVIDSLTGLYLMFDGLGRSSNKALADVRVRKAMAMAIDRDALIKNVVPGGSVARRLDAMCFDSMEACGYTLKPPAYDPDGAKKLLAEAGYPNGFDFVLDTQIRARDVAQAIGGMLYRVGIRTTVNTVNTIIMFKRWEDGEVQGLLNNSPAGNWPDASKLLDNVFGVAARDTIRDPVILKGIEAGFGSHDPAKRKAEYTTVFNRINELTSHLPISSVPVVWAHLKTVKIDSNPLSETQSNVTDVFWK